MDTITRQGLDAASGGGQSFSLACRTRQPPQVAGQSFGTGYGLDAQSEYIERSPYKPMTYKINYIVTFIADSRYTLR